MDDDGNQSLPKTKGQIRHFLLSLLVLSLTLLGLIEDSMNLNKQVENNVMKDFIPVSKNDTQNTSLFNSTMVSKSNATSSNSQRMFATEIKNKSNHVSINNVTQHRPVTIVVQLSGELGNQIGKISSGLYVQNLIKTRLGLKTEIKLRAQDSSKWKRAMQWTKEAFPNTRSMDFREANTFEFDEMRSLQAQWIDEKLAENKFNLTHIKDPHSLKHLKSNFHDAIEMLRQAWTMEKPANVSGGNFSFPFVYVDRFLPEIPLFEECYTLVRDFFTIDEKAICKKIPDPDETVFHFRNFLTEMPGRGKRLGFEELSANKTAKELFANHKPGEKVAIISRFGDKVDEYIQAMESIRGLKVRYIENQTGNEDFCFLVKAQKEIIATKMSTFSLWAGVLGDAKKVRMYTVDSKDTRDRGLVNWTQALKNANISYSPPELKEKFLFEFYEAD